MSFNKKVKKADRKMTSHICHENPHRVLHNLQVKGAVLEETLETI